MDEPSGERADEQVQQPIGPAQINGLAPGMTIIRHVRGPRRWPGLLACILAALMLAATGAGIQVASTGSHDISTVLAYAAIGLSFAAILFGLIAIFGRWARGAGVVAVIVAGVGNPLVLLSVLGSLSGS